MRTKICHLLVFYLRDIPPTSPYTCLKTYPTDCKFKVKLVYIARPRLKKKKLPYNTGGL
jgi:hypothetical protein